MDERRYLPRFALEVPLQLKLAGSDATIAGKTRDVSGAGVFFYVDRAIPESSEVQFTMTLPPELTRTAAIQVECRGTVLRVTHDATGGQAGVAASIFSYDFLPS